MLKSASMAALYRQWQPPVAFTELKPFHVAGAQIEAYSMVFLIQILYYL